MKRKTNFRKLHSRIFHTLFLIPAIFLLIVSIVTSTSTSILYRNSFDSSFRGQMSTITSRFEIGFSQWDANAKSLTGNQSFQAACENKDETIIARDLRTLTLSNSAFLGCLYYHDNTVITSADISGAPTSKELFAQKDIKDFYQSSLTSYASIRKEAISSAYFTSPYQKNQGMFSFFTKVYSTGNNLLGLLEIDLRSKEVYEHFLSVDSVKYMENAVSYLCDGTNILVRPEEEAVTLPIEENSSAKPISFQADYLMKKDFSDSILKDFVNGFSLYVLVPKKGLKTAILIVNFSILAADTILILFFYFLAKNQADKDCKRLDAISDEMKKASEEEA